MGLKSKLTISLILLCLTFLNFGNYYIFDVPQELAGDFLRYFDKTPADSEHLYSFYSIPATPMALLSGFIISWLTPTLTIVISTYMIFISAVLTLWGVHSINYNYVLLGRFVYGVFAEPNQISQNSLISEVFFGKFLSLATGLGQVVNNLGLAGSIFLTGRFWLTSRNMSVPFFWAALSCIVSFVGASVWSLIELGNYKKVIEDGQNKTSIKASDENENENQNNSNEEILEKKTHSHGGKIDFSMIKDLNDGLIILCMGNLMLGSQSYFMFTQMSTECLIKRFGLSLEEAKNRLFLMPLLALIAIPFYSFLVGKYGKKTL